MAKLYLCLLLATNWASYNYGWASRPQYLLNNRLPAVNLHQASIRISPGECKEICKLRDRMGKVEKPETKR